MLHADPEFLCLLAVVVVAGLCYLSGWTSRVIWIVFAGVIAVVHIFVSHDRDHTFSCTAAMVLVSVLCGFAGRFDRRR